MQLLGYKTTSITGVRTIGEKCQIICAVDGKRQYNSMDTEKMQKILDKLGLQQMQELIGMKILERVVEGGKKERAYIPRGVTLTIAARDENGNLIDLKFE